MILSALAALAHASDAAAKYGGDSISYHIDPQTGHTVECDENGC